MEVLADITVPGSRLCTPRCARAPRWHRRCLPRPLSAFRLQSGTAPADRQRKGRARPREKGIRVARVRASSEQRPRALVRTYPPSPPLALVLQNYLKHQNTCQITNTRGRHTGVGGRVLRVRKGVIGERHYTEFGSGKGTAAEGRWVRVNINAVDTIRDWRTCLHGACDEWHHQDPVVLG